MSAGAKAAKCKSFMRLIAKAAKEEEYILPKPAKLEAHLKGSVVICNAQ